MIILVLCFQNNFAAFTTDNYRDESVFSLPFISTGWCSAVGHMGAILGAKVVTTVLCLPLF